MESPVAIFSERNDLHAAAVQWALARNGIPTLFAPDVSRLTGDISVHAGGQGLSWRATQAGVPLTHVRSAWFRRPKPPAPKNCLEEDRGFVAQQWTLFQKNIFDLGDGLIDALWVNRPHAALAAESKLLQLQHARSVGLMFPDMVVTNRAEDVAQLIRRWGRVVYKSFYPHTWHNASLDTYHSVGVVLLDANSELPQASIAMCPGIFQRYIDKKAEMRVTVIGSRMYAIKILKRDGGAFLDWRNSAMDDVTIMQPCQLDGTLEQKIRGLMQRLGIVFGCIDLVIDHDDNVFFLEVNQAGQFLFVEDKVSEMPLLQSMAAMLGEGRCDYSMNANNPTRLSDYMASDDYRQIAQSLENATASVAAEH